MSCQRQNFIINLFIEHCIMFVYIKKEITQGIGQGFATVPHRHSLTKIYRLSL